MATKDFTLLERLWQVSGQYKAKPEGQLSCLATKVVPPRPVSDEPPTQDLLRGERLSDQQ